MAMSSDIRAEPQPGKRSLDGLEAYCGEKSWIDSRAFGRIHHGPGACYASVLVPRLSEPSLPVWLLGTPTNGARARQALATPDLASVAEGEDHFGGTRGRVGQIRCDRRLKESEKSSSIFPDGRTRRKGRSNVGTCDSGVR